MSILAGPLLIGLSIWLYLETIKSLKYKIITQYTVWTITIVLSSFFIETIGVKTGLIFGVYSYGITLWPQIMGVPVAIGFAWFTMLISSIALMKHILIYKNSNIWIKIFIIAILMTFFDYMMEPAAIKLNYWNWKTVSVPIQNYVAWFLLSYLLTILAWKMKVLEVKFPRIVMHAYFAQLIYFILIMFK
ncbi:MAG: carotenoid biosynthesis protein [Calditrichaceae bacterium]